jgi:hypothetical protein
MRNVYGLACVRGKGYGGVTICVCRPGMGLTCILTPLGLIYGSVVLNTAHKPHTNQQEGTVLDVDNKLRLKIKVKMVTAKM